MGSCPVKPCQAVFRSPIAALLLIPVAGLADTMDRARKGDFDAVGQIPCAQEVGEVLGVCAAAVARDSRAATVVVAFGNGFKRRLTFTDGAFVKGDATMSGVGTDTDWRLEDGVHWIRVDDQRFEIPDALVFGE